MSKNIEQNQTSTIDITQREVDKDLANAKILYKASKLEYNLHTLLPCSPR